MAEFWLYFEKGLRHIPNLYAYDHILFLIVLAVPYTFKDWKRLLILATIFTVGHSLSLLLAVYGMVSIKVNLVEFLIPMTILIMGFFNLFTAGKSSKQESIGIIGFVTLFFGIIHGLGFAGYFKSVVSGSSKLVPLSAFSLGIEASQIVVILMVLVLSYVVQTFFRFSKRDWALVMSAFVIGVVLPMLISSRIWNR